MRRSRIGLTLVEILVGISMAGIVLALLIGLWRGMPAGNEASPTSYGAGVYVFHATGSSFPQQLSKFLAEHPTYEVKTVTDNHREDDWNFTYTVVVEEN